MADNEEVEEAPSRGAEWEVVSLTASAYAAAPGPREVELKDDDRGHTAVEDDTELARALFMSGHFVFPPSQHENLPLQPNSEIRNDHGGNVVAPELGVQDGKASGKDKDNWTVKDMTVQDEFPGLPLSDKKGNSLTIPCSELEEQTTLLGLNRGDKEQRVYSDSVYSSFPDETALSAAATFIGSTADPEVVESPDKGLYTPRDILESPKHATNVEHDESGLPCGVWWKRRAVSLYSHAKEGYAFWSVFTAAAVVGLVILGQHWQQERWQALQLRWLSSMNSENSGRILGPISRLKDVVVGGERRGSFMRGSSTD